MKRLLLIDADILAYKVAAVNEQEFDFGEGGVARILRPEKVAQDAQDVIDDLMVRLDGDDFRVMLSDPEKNWRKALEPTYKENRKATKKPALLDDTKRYLYGEYASSVVPWLEADDAMGILATSPKRKHEVVICSEDKDMRTIPGLVYHPHRPENGIMEITRVEADQFHLWQTLVGDTTDGYPGCPGIGKASEYVLDLLTLDDPLEMWDCVLEAYASKGFPEKAAVHQARLASICRWSNWDASKKQIRLWTPIHLLF